MPKTNYTHEFINEQALNFNFRPSKFYIPNVEIDNALAQRPDLFSSLSKKLQVDFAGFLANLSNDCGCESPNERFLGTNCEATLRPVSGTARAWIKDCAS